jgi:NAD(P)-dependent dehydrogenase (short-subunit alcohol dehydrogenase family)
VAPGRLLTESPPRAAATRDPAHVAFMQKQIPLGRFATVEEVAEAVAYFAGSRSGSVTGQVLAVDGGLTVA